MMPRSSFSFPFSSITLNDPIRAILGSAVPYLQYSDPRQAGSLLLLGVQQLGTLEHPQQPSEARPLRGTSTCPSSLAQLSLT